MPDQIEAPHIVPNKDVPEVLQVADTFKGWFRIKGRKVHATFEVLFAIPGLTLLFGLFARYLPSTAAASSKPTAAAVALADWVAIGVLLFQSAVVFLLFLFIPKVPQLRPAADESDDSRVHNGSEALAEHWARAWVLWALLYFVLGIGKLLQLWFPHYDFALVTPLKNFMDNIQTIFFIMCFRELRFPTHGKRSPLFGAISGVAVLAACEMIMLIPGIPAKAHVAGMTFSEVMSWTTGCAGGVAIALLAGALESKMIKGPVSVTILLYVYASIQGAFPFLGTDPYRTLIFTSLAFVLKLLLFVFMAWFIESGIILFYFTKMLELDDKTPQERRSFLEDRVLTLKAFGRKKARPPAHRPTRKPSSIR